MTRTLLNTMLAFVLAAHAGLASATTANDLLADYSRKAGSTAAADRGRAFFNTTHGREWSCATCHGATPTGGGKHASTGKPIGALAPAANAERFTDPAKVEKWFRRNCNDVLGRECAPAEKADVLAWLMTLKP
jgi:mono/diheme cytochrome c family protein